MLEMPTTRSASRVATPTTTASRRFGGAVDVMLTAEETRSGSVGKKIRYSITLSVRQRTFHSPMISRNPHEHEATPLYTELSNAQQRGGTLGPIEFFATSDVRATRRQSQNVAYCSYRAQSAEQHPPGRQALAAPALDDFCMLRNVGHQDTKDQEAGKADGEGVGRG